MKTKAIILTIILATAITASQFTGTENFYHPEFREKQNNHGVAYAYPPGVGILTKSKNCLACHVNNGPWTDEARTIVDVQDATTKKSLRAPDGSFRLEVVRGEPRTV